MSLKHTENIPEEIHNNTTQFIRVESGEALIRIDNKKITLKDGGSVIIPAGSYHFIDNIGKTDLKLNSIYSPPEHKHGLIHKRQPKNYQH
jgi:mannose-6-phosphate isomerase-like protein (cupin superfamily)